MNAFRARREARGRVDLLPPEPKRPAETHKRRAPARLEVVDADFVVIRASATRTSNDNLRPQRTAQTSDGIQHALLHVAAAIARFCEAGLQLLSGRAFAGLVAAIFVFVFAYAGGLTALRAALPAAETSPRIADVITTIDDRNGMKVLAVYGRLHNDADTVQAARAIDIIVEGSDKPLHRRVMLETATLAPGAGEHFALRIPYGGGKVPKVSVSLAAEGAPAN